MSFKNQKYILLFFLIATLFALLFLITLPLTKEIISISENLEKEKTRLASARLLIDNFDNFERDYQAYSREFEEMENILTKESFIDPELPIGFINFFKDQAETLELNLKIVPVLTKTEAKSIDQKWEQTNFRIEWVGNYLNTMRFIEKLENSRWLIEITNITLSRYIPSGKNQEDRQDQETLIQANIFIRAYAKKQ